MNEMWNFLTSQAKVGLALGAAVIVALAIAIGVWAYRPDYQVLFADLAVADAASMTAELDRMKIPYQLADGGNTILVSKESVYKTRLKLMGKDLPLHGAVGFEVFNNADFGMTEFVQKVNYQRAIQGELTRTILSIDDIQSARVHLAIPEQGLFKKAATNSKASVTVVMKPGKQLATEQIVGIQRLVAASVPDIAAADVTVLDQRGVALTRPASTEPGLENANNQLESKRSTEEYMTRKVSKILDSTFGPGMATATVDVELNLDQDRVTTEEVLPAKSAAPDGAQLGVVVHERQTMHDNGSGTNGVATAAIGHEAQSGNVTSFDNEYQVGRRVEQTVVAPGGTRRLTIAVVVKNTLDDAQIEKIKQVVSQAVGLNPLRGDVVVVSSMNGMVNATVDPATAATPGNSGSATGESAALDQLQPQQDGAKHLNSTPAPATFHSTTWIIMTLATFLVLAAFALLFRKAALPQAKKRLTDLERDKLLYDVRQWIDGKSPQQAGAGEPK
ncbi:MAG TPA: flagellar basal-body MS-ring/collar protein FliF [Burkholderiaceae bacterium]|nr:flagellar basal-body MS-ring/collar protein FliF [Burkholderiaceae bacterium]